MLTIMLFSEEQHARLRQQWGEQGGDDVASGGGPGRHRHRLRQPPPTLARRQGSIPLSRGG